MTETKKYKVVLTAEDIEEINRKLRNKSKGKNTARSVADILIIDFLCIITAHRQRRSELAAWESERNSNHDIVNWHFSNNNSRFKLVSLYPIIAVFGSARPRSRYHFRNDTKYDRKGNT